VFCYVHEAIMVLTVLAPTQRQAITVAVRNTHVSLDGTLLRIDGVGIGSARLVIG
jgi:hypothetical protein